MLISQMFAGRFYFSIVISGQIFMVEGNLSFNVHIFNFRDASMMAMRRKIAGMKPEQIKQLAKEELDLPVSHKDFCDALEKCNKSVSQEDLDKYETWMNEFGSA